MQSLIKIPLLLIFFFFNASALDLSSLDDSSFNYGVNQSFLPYGVSAQSISDVEILNNSFLKINNDIYVYRFDELLFNLSKSNASGYYYEGNLSHIATLYYYDSKFEKITIPCEGSDINNIRACSRRYVLGSKDVLPVEFSYYRKFFIQKIRSCESDENFNTDTQQCQKCPDGQSWDPSTNSCFNDCSDLNKNKYGFTDGSCADCSGEKESFDVKKCYCNFIGSSPRLQNIELIQGDFRFTSCTDGSQFWYKIPGTPDVDNNKTKPDLKNPSPGGNGTKPDDPNNPNQGGGNQGGNSGGGGGNNGGSQDNPNPNSGDGESQEKFCKEHPKDPKCKKGNKGEGNTTIINNNGGGNNSNGDNLKFTPDGSADKYEKDINDFAGKFKDAVGGIVGEFGNFKKGVDQLIANIEGKGIKDVKSQAIPSSCPREFTVDMFGNSYSIRIDYCKYIAPAANVLYYIFYILFFLAFLLGVYKTVLFLI